VLLAWLGEMLRLPVVRATGLASGRHCAVSFHTTSSKSQQELVELFIDDKPVQVPPGTTVLQVRIIYSPH